MPWSLCQLLGLKVNTALPHRAYSPLAKVMDGGTLPGPVFSAAVREGLGAVGTEEEKPYGVRGWEGGKPVWGESRLHRGIDNPGPILKDDWKVSRGVRYRRSRTPGVSSD